MNVKDEFKLYAKSKLWRTRSSYLWYPGKELVAAIWLQKSNWSNTYYVEIGIVEIEFMVRDYPPIAACWGAHVRVGNISFEHRDIFSRIELHEPPYDDDALRAGVRWCVDYVEFFAERPGLVRDIVLRRAVPDHPELWTSPWCGNHLMDWANGKLGRPEEYFPYLPPYFNIK